MKKNPSRNVHFSKGPSEILDAINTSIDFDQRLYKEDIEVSIAHCKMLTKSKIIIGFCILDKNLNYTFNLEYFAFDVTNKEISNLFNVEYQSTILIFKDNKEVYRSIGETSKKEIYKVIKKFI